MINRLKKPFIIENDKYYEDDINYFEDNIITFSNKNSEEIFEINFNLDATTEGFYFSNAHKYYLKEKLDNETSNLPLSEIKAGLVSGTTDKDFLSLKEVIDIFNQNNIHTGILNHFILSHIENLTYYILSKLYDKTEENDLINKEIFNLALKEEFKLISEKEPFIKKQIEILFSQTTKENKAKEINLKDLENKIKDYFNNIENSEICLNIDNLLKKDKLNDKIDEKIKSQENSKQSNGNSIKIK